MTRHLETPYLTPSTSPFLLLCVLPEPCLSTCDNLCYGFFTCLSLPKSLGDSKSILFILECTGIGAGLVFINGHLPTV